MKLKTYIKQYQEINNIVDIVDAKIQGYKTNESGLVPEEIRLSPEYVEDRIKFNQAFNTLRDFNKTTKKEAKQFRKKYGHYASIMSIKI